MEKVALTNAKRAELVQSLVGKPVLLPRHKYQRMIEDGGDCVFLVAIINGVHSRPAAMIRKKEGKVIANCIGDRLDTTIYRMHKALTGTKSV